jgi:hypothetical protein
MISAATLGVGRPSFLSLRGISYRSATAVLPPGWAKPLSNATGVLLSGETERQNIKDSLCCKQFFEEF